MPKRKYFDEQSEKNCIRVREHRERKKIISNYQKNVQQQIESISKQQISIHGYTNKNHDVIKSPEKDLSFATEFKDKLRLWASNHNISGEAINGLLVILIWAGFTFLPKDSRTLKKTPPKVPIDILSNGKLFYYGLGKCLVKVLASAYHHIDSITLNFNFDGFPVAKSSSSQFWPILAAIKGDFMYKFNKNFTIVHF